MIFKTVNAKVEKTSYDIELKNIDLASGHWGSEKIMTDYLDAIENFTYDQATLNKNIVLHALKLLKNNIRIKDVKFYRIPEENRIILLAITNVGKFKDVPLFEREMSISFKRDKFSFAIIELIKEEYDQIEKGEKIIPENWKLDEQITSKVKLLKEYQ